MESVKVINSLTFPREKILHLPPIPPSFLKCEWLPSQTIEGFCKKNEEVQNGAPFPFAVSSVKYSEIKSARILSKGEDVKTILDIEINVENHGIDFLPGDTIGIIPFNQEEEVSIILKSLGIVDEANQLLKTTLDENTAKKKALLPAYIPPYSTAHTLLKAYLEIRAIPKKGFLRVLSDFTSEEIQKRRLQELCSREGSSEYEQFFIKDRLNLLNILRSFPSCKPPFSILLEHLPRLQARPYSIASSPYLNSSCIRIVLSVFNDSEAKRGVCSGWLQDITLPFVDITRKLDNLSLLDKEHKVMIPMYFRQTTDFRVPSSPSVPLILIGPGTGVSPLIGFLQHRKAQYEEMNILQPERGENWLFFGCRYSDRDYSFKSEMETLLEEKILSKLFLSFSRDANESKSKYVQDEISSNKVDFVNQLLDKEASLFICGEGTKTIKYIEELIITCIKNVKGIPEEEAKNIFSSLQKNGKILKDTWV